MNTAPGVITIGDCALCASLVYSNSDAAGGWTSTHLLSSITGFQGRTFSRDGALIVAFRGTDSYLDMLTTWPELLTSRPPLLQLGSAMDLAREGLKEEARRIVVTGHSLGGALAKIVATHLNIPAVLFNAPDVKLFLGRERPWIKSIAATGDPVSSWLGASDTLLVAGLTKQEVRDRVCLPLNVLGLEERHEMKRILRGIEAYSDMLFQAPVPPRGA